MVDNSTIMLYDIATVKGGTYVSGVAGCYGTNIRKEIIVRIV